MVVRHSKQNKAILRVLRETTSHPTAVYIYEQVRKEIPDISLGTVYRNLGLLKQEGKILELGLAGTPNRFDGNTQSHCHFRCEQCGCVYDVDEPVDRGRDERVARKTGFKIYYCGLQFRGLCKGCQS